MRSLTYLTAILFTVAGLLSCTPKEETSAEKPTVVEVRAVYNAETNEHLFETETDTIPSGWTTFRLTNASQAVHFLLVDHLPGDKTAEDAEKEVVPPFQEAMDLINEGKREEGMAKLGDLPEWFGEITYMGGPGMTSPGKSSNVTVNLKPGNYLLECYLKTEDGIFHGVLGMTRALYVTEDSTAATAPSDPSIEIDLSNEGFDVTGDLTPGQHLVAVHFNAEDPPLLGNDVHVAKLDENTDLEEVATWMDWSQPNGLVTSADNPAPATFVGGTHDMPMGNTAYFTIDLEPGRYAWISERSASDPMYKEFTVENME